MLDYKHKPFPIPSRTQIAHAMTHESYAMIYGFNTFMSLLLQTFLTLAVSDSRGLNLDIPTQVNMNNDGGCVTKTRFKKVG